MVIILVFWQIKPTEEAVAAFLDWWRTKAIVKDRSGLIGEYLSQPSEGMALFEVDDPPWSEVECHPFVNVGLWKDAESFHEQIRDYMTVVRQPFEAVLRKRVCVDPVASRMGSWPLPANVD